MISKLGFKKIDFLRIVFFVIIEVKEKVKYNPQSNLLLFKTFHFWQITLTLGLS